MKGFYKFFSSIFKIFFKGSPTASGTQNPAIQWKPALLQNPSPLSTPTDHFLHGKPPYFPVYLQHFKTESLRILGEFQVWLQNRAEQPSHSHFVQDPPETAVNSLDVKGLPRGTQQRRRSTNLSQRPQNSQRVALQPQLA